MHEVSEWSISSKSSAILTTLRRWAATWKYRSTNAYHTQYYWANHIDCNSCLDMVLVGGTGRCCCRRSGHVYPQPNSYEKQDHIQDGQSALVVSEIFIDRSPAWVETAFPHVLYALQGRQKLTIARMCCFVQPWNIIPYSKCSPFVAVSGETDEVYNRRLSIENKENGREILFHRFGALLKAFSTRILSTVSFTFDDFVLATPLYKQSMDGMINIDLTGKINQCGPLDH